MRMSFTAEDEDAFQIRDGLLLIAVGPATLPDPAQHAESAAAAPVLAQMRALWEFCADPGRPLTQKGHLRMTDARHLAAVLDTGDDQRSPRASADLPVLSWLVELAIEARVLCRHQDRLVSVERWRELSAVEALGRLVEYALDAGLSGPASPEETWIHPIREVVDESVGRLLAELIDCQASGTPMPIDELAGFMAEIMNQAFAGLPESALGAIRGWVRTQLDRLALLGVVTLHDQVVELTPAGVVIAVALAEDLGLTVLCRPDPVTATARDLVTLIERMRPAAWLADAGAWVAHQGAEPAARELVSVITDPSTSMPVAVAVLTQLNGLVGEHAVPAIKTMLDGPRDSVAVQALLVSGDLDPVTLDPGRVLRAGIEMMAVAYDVGGPEDLISALSAGDGGPDGQLEIIDRLWRTGHPRVVDLLEAIGTHHPDNKIAKSARKALLKHRSFLASQR